MDKTYGLLPCPFCGVHLGLMESEFNERIYEHPDNDCIAEDIFVADELDYVTAWNTRAALEDKP